MEGAAAAALAKPGPVCPILLFTQVDQEEGELLLIQSPGSHPT